MLVNQKYKGTTSYKNKTEVEACTSGHPCEAKKMSATAKQDLKHMYFIGKDSHSILSKVL